MPKKKLIGFRLDEVGEAKLNLLVAGARSREEWFRGVVRERVARLVHINELAIASYQHEVEAWRLAAESATDASEAADAKARVREYRDLIAKHDAENIILRKDGL